MEPTRLAKLKGSGPGAHTISTDEIGRFVVEWYDFGPDVPYESANMLIFGRTELAALAQNLSLDADVDPQRVADALAARFDSYFAIRTYLDGAGLHYWHEVDFQP